MLFSLKPDTAYLKGKRLCEVIKTLDALGWEGCLDQDTNTIEISRPGIFDRANLDAEGYVSTNMLINHEGLTHVDSGMDLSFIEAVPMNKSFNGRELIDALVLPDDSLLFGWSLFYNVEPFSGVKKLKNLRCRLARDFIDTHTIKCGKDQIPLDIWKKFTSAAIAGRCALHKHLKMNFIYYSDSRDLNTLMRSLGSIEPIDTGVSYQIERTGEVTTLHPGDLILYNKDIILHLQDPKDLGDFEILDRGV